jgi:hypothetical protein
MNGFNEIAFRSIRSILQLCGACLFGSSAIFQSHTFFFSILTRFFSNKVSKMKFILPLSFFLVCLFTNALSAAVVEQGSLQKMASSVYKKQLEGIKSFVKSTGTKLENDHHSSLRTESVTEYDHASVHFTFYYDNACATEPVFYNDFKVNTCSYFLPLTTVVAASHSTWTLNFKWYDDAQCALPTTAQWVVVAKKNHCYPYQHGIYVHGNVGLYFKLNVMGEPRKAIPGGGNALVYYENAHDCTISKNNNLGRAQFVASWPTNVCGYDSEFDNDWKAASCNNDEMTFTSYPQRSDVLTCDGTPQTVAFTKGSDTCTEIDGYEMPVRFSCLPDSN